MSSETPPAGEQVTLTGELARDPWDDKELLEWLYHECGLTIRELGILLECDYTLIHRRMYEFGIERRGSAGGPGKTNYAAFKTREDGYEYWQSRLSSVLVHRLLAVSEYGFDAVAGGVVHHRNRVQWDNRPENIEVLDSHRDHVRVHRDLHREERIGEGQQRLTGWEQGQL